VKFGLLFIGVITNASASVLVRLAVQNQPAKGLSLLAEWPSVYGQWSFWMALLLYGVSFALYSATVSQLPLNVVHPVFTATSIALVTAASFLYFNEPLDLKALVGITAILLGVFLLSSRVNAPT
jgi:small multidrug resistance pump